MTTKGAKSFAESQARRKFEADYVAGCERFFAQFSGNVRVVYHQSPQPDPESVEQGERFRQYAVETHFQAEQDERINRRKAVEERVSKRKRIAWERNRRQARA